MKIKHICVSAGLVAAIILPACGSAARSPVRPAVVNHVVFIRLVEPADAGALIKDSDKMLGSIPSVISYYAGRHVEIGRENVVRDYDVGLYVGFDSVGEYEAYLAHPDHVGLVESWKPRIEWLRIYDVSDPTP